MSDEPAAPERKASEVILTIEQKVDCLLRYFQAIDFNLKVLINRVNEIDEKITNAPPRAIELPAAIEFPPANIAMPPVPIAIEAPINKTISVDSELPVVQKLIYHTGAPIRLCNVEILDHKGVKLKKIRTNHVGKWTSNLFPGVYSVKIYRSAVDKYSQIDDTYNITIPPNQSGSFELPDHKSL